MRNTTRRLVAIVTMVGIGCAVAVPAIGAPVTTPIIFDGPEQMFETNLSGDGSLNLFFPVPATALSGNAILPNPNPYFTTLGVTPTNFTSVPISLATNMGGTATSASATFDSTTWDVTDLNDINLDLLNGNTGQFAIDEFTIDFLLNNLPVINDLPINVSLDLSSLKFFQSGPATVGLGGAFMAPGTLQAVGSAVIDAGILGSFGSDVDFEFTGNLAGTAAAMPLMVGNPDDVKLTLDGDFNLNFPLDVSTLVGVDSPGLFIGTLDVMLTAGVNFNIAYHLEDVVSGIHTVPEPGSFILLGIGLAAMVPFVRRMRKKA